MSNRSRVNPANASCHQNDSIRQNGGHSYHAEGELGGEDALPALAALGVVQNQQSDSSKDLSTRVDN